MPRWVAMYPKLALRIGRGELLHQLGAQPLDARYAFPTAPRSRSARSPSFESISCTIAAP